MQKIILIALSISISFSIGCSNMNKTQKGAAVGIGEVSGQGNDPNAVAQNRKVEIYIAVAPPPEQANK